MSMRSRARGRGCRSGGVQQSARIITVMRLSASLFLAVTMSVVGAGFVLAELDNDWTIKKAPKRGFL
jgi:hypothetical protein